MSASVVIGITGGSGSGKSSLVEALSQSLGAVQVAVLTQDDYYRPIEQQSKDSSGKVNFDLPEAIDLARFASGIDELKSGKTITVEEYVFNQSGRKGSTKEIRPAEVIIVEGLFLLCDDAIRARLDHVVFIESDHQVQLSRRITRDLNDRGYPMSEVRYQWDNHVMPAYRNYLLPFREDCDMIIDNSGTLDDMLQEVIDYLAIRVGLPIASPQLL